MANIPAHFNRNQPGLLRGVGTVVGGAYRDDRPSFRAVDRGAEAARCGSSERALLLPYAHSKSEEQQALTFEAHLLACEACFQDLKTLDCAGALIRELGSLDLVDQACRLPSLADRRSASDELPTRQRRST